MSLFKYCDLYNNSTSHQLVLKQVSCTALMITVLVLTLACCVLERCTNKSTVEPRRCLCLDVRTSSLEADLRMPGNRDEFPFSQAEWSLPSYFPPLYVFRKFQCSERKTLSSQYDCLSCPGVKMGNLNRNCQVFLAE